MKKITRIHQIEITSECNLKCKYCVHPKMQREKMHMDRHTYMKSLDLAYDCYVKFGQTDLNLAGIGESTLHPDFINYVRMAREAMPNINLVLATNGIAKSIDMIEEIASGIAPYKPQVYVSIHRPERAAHAVNIYKKHGILAGISADPSIASVNWAGQVDFPVSTPTKDTPCPWLSQGMVMVASDGSLLKCCFDGDGISKMGHVDEGMEIFNKTTAAFGMCRDCHHSIPSLFNKAVGQ